VAVGATYKVVEKWGRGMNRKLIDIAETEMKLGITEKSGAPEHPNSNERTIGDIAFFNEYGTMTAPARSFVHDWVAGNIDLIAKNMETDVLRVLMSSESMKVALSKRGVVYRNSVIKRIMSRIPPPNAESTIAAKGSDIPLIDTATMLAAIVYEVGRKK